MAGRAAKLSAPGILQRRGHIMTPLYTTAKGYPTSTGPAIERRRPGILNDGTAPGPPGLPSPSEVLVMATVSTPRIGRRLVLQGVDWRTYSRLVRAFDGRRSLRLTYDRGVLELMTITFGPERWGHLLDRFIVVLTE